MNQQPPGAPSSATASVTSPIISPSNGGALPVELLHRRRWRRCRWAGTMLLLVRVFDAFADVFADEWWTV